MKPKKCKECGKIFIPRCGTQVYCDGPHFATCSGCGQSFAYTCRPTERPHTCSRECQEVMKRNTLLATRGVINVSQLPEVRQKISERNGSPEVKAKRAATSLAHTGYDNPAKSPEIRKKMSKKMKTPEYLEKRAATCLKIYDAPSPMQNERVKAKQKATNQQNYNMDGHPHTRSDYMKMMIDPSKVDNYLSFKHDPKSYLSNHYTCKPTVAQLEQDLGVTNTPIYNILIQHDCREMIQTSYSNLENEVFEYIQSITSNVSIERNNRTAIRPYELDIYIPQFRVGFECNPVYTHNSSSVDLWGSKPKAIDYHQMKSILAKSANIFLFHIFGYAWNLKNNIVKSIISDSIDVHQSIIDSADTHVVELDESTYSKFLLENCYQGNVPADIRLGLVHNQTEQLVMAMSFNDVVNSTCELLCCCTAVFTKVVQGSNKLFNYFCNVAHPNQVIAYSDIASDSATVYAELGFVAQTVTPPNYVWVDKYDRAYYTDIDDIVNLETVAKVFDAGQQKWLWQNLSPKSL